MRTRRPHLRPFTRRPVDFDSTIVNLQSPDEIHGAFEGLDAVIHLAADPSPRAPWESIREHNLEATYQVFEECRRSGVKRLIFASTNHTQHGNTILTTPETLDTSAPHASSSPSSKSRRGNKTCRR